MEAQVKNAFLKRNGRAWADVQNRDIENNSPEGVLGNPYKICNS